MIPINSCETIVGDFVEDLLSHGLYQICNVPNSNGTFLDLVFITASNACSLCESAPLHKNEIHIIPPSSIDRCANSGESSHCIDAVVCV